MSDSIIEDGIFRFFAKALDKETCVEAERSGRLPEQWNMAVENGFTNLLSSEEHGGSAVAWADAFPLFWGLGYYRVPLPIAEAVIANFVLSSAGLDAESSAPIALVDEFSSARLEIDGSRSSGRLSGAVVRVHWGRAAEKVLIGLPGNRLGLYDLQSTTVRIRKQVDVTKLPSDMLAFEGAVPIQTFDSPFPNVDAPLRHFGAVARSAMMVGAAEFALEESVQYAQDRVQFGKPIGKNQAIQQQIAQMAGQISMARHASTLAFLQVPSWLDSSQAGSAISAGCAKVLAGEAADASTTVAHQVHGALGFTYEHVLNFATRRLWAWREDHGTASWWARRIGRTVAQHGGNAFWPAVTRPNHYQDLATS